MSRDQMELALWELSVDRHAKARFREDEARWLARYGLRHDEVDLLVRRDVAGIQRRGVNPMLTMGFWLAHVGPDLGPYQERLRAAAVDDQGRGGEDRP